MVVHCPTVFLFTVYKYAWTMLASNCSLRPKAIPCFQIFFEVRKTFNMVLFDLRDEPSSQHRSANLHWSRISACFHIVLVACSRSCITKITHFAHTLFQRARQVAASVWRFGRYCSIWVTGFSFFDESEKHSQELKIRFPFLFPDATIQTYYSTARPSKHVIDA